MCATDWSQSFAPVITVGSRVTVTRPAAGFQHTHKCERLLQLCGGDLLVNYGLQASCQSPPGSSQLDSSQTLETLAPPFPEGQIHVQRDRAVLHLDSSVSSSRAPSLSGELHAWLPMPSRRGRGRLRTQRAGV